MHLEKTQMEATSEVTSEAHSLDKKGEGKVARGPYKT